MSITLSFTTRTRSLQFSVNPFCKWWKRQYYWFESYKMNGFATTIGFGPFCIMLIKDEHD